jgi:hypothetical protein
MSVKLKIEVEGPLGPGDKDILTGATMILISLAQQFSPAEEPAEARPCADLEYTGVYPDHQATGRVCVNEVGHKGRHKYRDLTPVGGLN